MRIAVDAMGGDFAPREVVLGAVQAARQNSQIETLFLVGDESAIRAELKSKGVEGEKVFQIVHATEVVGMHEAPAASVRRKRDSSISRAIDLVKDGEAQAVFSAGNTGAVVAAATLKLRTLPGIVRPAIAAVVPTPVKPFMLVDAGANTDCIPEMLIQFGVMGSVYSKEILGVNNPTVGVLSIGEEDKKGNETTRETFRMLEASQLNFIGNVESKDLFEGKVDVVVCDGFVGNVVLKTSEAVAKAIGHWLKEEFTRNLFRITGAAMLRNALKSIKGKSNPESYGGAPLLGANGVCIIGHGSSSAIAACNGIEVAAQSVSHEISHLIEEGVAGLQSIPAT
jgi:glycerol-3-phosphate acyltransferase PlsX